MNIWLIEIRKKKKRSQIKMAEESGISQSHYAAIENGTRNPSVKVAKKIADVLGFKWTKFYEK